jgi:antitoxin PrlF
MATATITSKGQTTIPKAIRRHLNLKTGDRIDFVIQPDGGVVLVAKKIHVADLCGVLGPAPRHLTIAEIDEEMRTGVARRYGRR